MTKIRYQEDEDVNSTIWAKEWRNEILSTLRFVTVCAKKWVDATVIMACERVSERASYRKFILATLWDFWEDEVKQAPKHVQAFVVVFFDDHLEIHTRELTQVSMGEWLLCTKDRTDFEAAFKTAASRDHLFVKLGWLRQTRVLSEIFKVENFCTSFARSSQNLGSVHLDESVHTFAE